MDSDSLAVTGRLRVGLGRSGLGPGFRVVTGSLAGRLLTTSVASGYPAPSDL